MVSVSGNTVTATGTGAGQALVTIIDDSGHKAYVAVTVTTLNIGVQ